MEGSVSMMAKSTRDSHNQGTSWLTAYTNADDLVKFFLIPPSAVQR